VKFDLKDLINLVTDNFFEVKRESANEIVRNHVLWSMGAGILPIPIADVAAVSAVQLNMIRKLCEKYEVDYSESLGKSLITALVGGTIARLGASLIKGIPIVGPVLGSLPMSLMSGASTYAVGQVFISHFEANGTLDNFDIEVWRRTYEEQLERGKEFASRWKDEAKSGNGFSTKNQSNTNSSTPTIPPDMDTIIAKLEKLNDLKSKGIITEEEFLAQKQRLLQHI
jgi:uncharacterized protein (DUF697 family)